MGNNVKDLQREAESDIVKLQEIKEESYQIKSQYLQLQETEMELLKELADVEDVEQ